MVSPAERIDEKRKAKALGLPSKTLAEEINAHYDEANDLWIEAGDKMTEALEHAIICGQKLTEAKKLCKHGQWGKFITDNLKFSQETASQYMRLFEHKDAIELDNHFDEPLSMRGALALLPKGAPRGKSAQATVKKAAVPPPANEIRDSAPNSTPTPPDEPALPIETELLAQAIAIVEKMKAVATLVELGKYIHTHGRKLTNAALENNQ